MLELAGVGKTVGDETHLAAIDLRLRAGVFSVLLGPTLAGKTSLLRVMAGLDRPTTGRVLFGGRDVTGVDVRRRNVAMVYQQFINYPTMTVFDNIASPLVAAKTPRPQIERQARETAALLRLTPFLTRRPAELSGGQQQRVALARALVKNAGLILLDEPLANLDYKLREELREELPRLFAGRGAVVVYATTDPVEALLLGGDTAALDEGRVAQFGAAGEVYHRPRNLRAAKIFSDPPLNTAPAIKRGERLVLGGRETAIGGRARGLPDGEFTLAFRAHHLLFEKPAGEALALKGEVQIAELAGSECFVHLRAAGRDWVAHAARARDWEIGAEIDLFIDPERLLFFDSEGARADDARE